MTEELAGKTAIVTGGARGIGLAIAQELAARGAAVILWGRTISYFDAASAGFTPAGLEAVDVTDAAAVQQAFELAVATHGRIDILVNNAGVNGPVMPSWDYPVETWNEIIAINLSGVFHCSKPAAAHMRAMGGGRILNIASMAGKDGVQYIAAYSAAKAGVIGLTKAMGKELALDGVLVNAIAPGMAETDILAQMTPEHIAATKAKFPMGRLLQLPEIAKLSAWIVGPDCSFTTGFTFDLSGGRATY